MPDDTGGERPEAERELSRAETQEPITESRSDEQINTIEARAAALRDFQPTGDQAADIERFLAASGRERYLTPTRGADRIELLTALHALARDRLDPKSEFYMQISEEDPERARKELFYRGIPQMERDAIAAILGDQLALASDVKPTREGSAQEAQAAAAREPGLSGRQSETTSEHNEGLDSLGRLTELGESIDERMLAFEMRILAIEQRITFAVELARGKIIGHGNTDSARMMTTLEGTVTQLGQLNISVFEKCTTARDDAHAHINWLASANAMAEQVAAAEMTYARQFADIEQTASRLERRADQIEQTASRIP